MLCGNDCSIVAWNDTEIQCTLPANPDGDCEAVIEIPGNGFAGINQVSPISYRFRVTDLSPKMGSLIGGTQLTITGEGFPSPDSCSDITIRMGESYTCEVKECANDYLICETRRVTEIKYIRNQGVHPTYGFGYKWSPTMTKVHPGDKVVWQWSLGSASDDKGINVFQTTNFGKFKVFINQVR